MTEVLITECYGTRNRVATAQIPSALMNFVLNVNFPGQNRKNNKPDACRKGTVDYLLLSSIHSIQLSQGLRYGRHGAAICPSNVMLATPFEVKECQFEIGFYQSIFVDILSIYKLALRRNGKHVSARCSSEMISSGLPTEGPHVSHTFLSHGKHVSARCLSEMISSGLPTAPL